jgi:hypothetical protein
MTTNKNATTTAQDKADRKARWGNPDNFTFKPITPEKPKPVN